MGPPCWENTVQQSQKGPASPVEVKATLRPNSIWQTVPSRNQWEAGQWVVILCLFAQENSSSWTEKKKKNYEKLAPSFVITLSTVALYIFIPVSWLNGTIYTYFGQTTLVAALIMFLKMKSFECLLLTWLGTQFKTAIHFQNALHSLLHSTVSQRFRKGKNKKIPYTINCRSQPLYIGAAQPTWILPLLLIIFYSHILFLPISLLLSHLMALIFLRCLSLLFLFPWNSKCQCLS